MIIRRCHSSTNLRNKVKNKTINFNQYTSYQLTYKPALSLIEVWVLAKFLPLAGRNEKSWKIWRKVNF